MRLPMSMQNNRLINWLEWDSLFFEKKIGACLLDAATEINHQLLEEALHAHYNCVYVWSNAALNKQPLPAEVKDIFQGVQLTFGLELPDTMHTMPTHETCRHSAPVPSMYPLAVSAGAWSRFFLDHHFPPEKSVQLYHRWLEASFTGTMGDTVISIGPPVTPTGLITVKKMEDTLQVGLISVDSAHRLKGMGSRLLRSAMQYAYAHHCKRITVTTQEQNTGAIAFYTHNHFHLLARRHIAHLWFT